MSGELSRVCYARTLEGQTTPWCDNCKALWSAATDLTSGVSGDMTLGEAREKWPCQETCG